MGKNGGFDRTLKRKRWKIRLIHYTREQGEGRLSFMISKGRWEYNGVGRADQQVAFDQVEFHVSFQLDESEHFKP